MFEVDVKNVIKGRRGPARVWGSDTMFVPHIMSII